MILFSFIGTSSPKLSAASSEFPQRLNKAWEAGFGLDVVYNAGGLGANGKHRVGEGFHEGSPSSAQPQGVADYRPTVAGLRQRGNCQQLKMARRTVKAHFNRLFVRFGIHDGIKRVKLATLLYRERLRSEASGASGMFRS